MTFCAHQGDAYGAGQYGYGKFLGTCLVASFAEIILSFLPPKVIQKLFPPVVTGSAVMLIGGGLIAAGMKYVGGGVFCGENTESRPVAFGDRKPQLCFNDNGKIAMSFGSAEYVGLAFSCIVFSILIQIFGSPFMKSTFIIWSLCFGCIIAAISGKDVDGDGEIDSYFRPDFMAKASTKPITFLWAEGTYPIGFSGTDFLPIFIGFLISSAETIGDVSMTCVYSDVKEDADIASRIQGGLLADGFNSFLACLFGSPPNTTFSQNNGLIALTKCASRSAGFSRALWRRLRLHPDLRRRRRRPPDVLLGPRLGHAHRHLRLHPAQPVHPDALARRGPRRRHGGPHLRLAGPLHLLPSQPRVRLRLLAREARLRHAQGPVDPRVRLLPHQRPLRRQQRQLLRRLQRRRQDVAQGGAHGPQDALRHRLHHRLHPQPHHPQGRRRGRRRAGQEGGDREVRGLSAHPPPQDGTLPSHPLPPGVSE